MFLSAAFDFIGANKKMDDGRKRYLGGQYINTSPAEVRAEARPVMMEHKLPSK